MSAQKPLVFLDIETTGRDREKHFMLEIALRVYGTDHEFHRVIHHYAGSRAITQMNAWCVEHHGRSCLLDEVAEAWRSAATVEGELLAFLKGAGFAKREAVVAGNSIHFDRGFLSWHMRELHEFLHYRMFDVSTVRRFILETAEPDTPVWRQAHERAYGPDTSAHRAKLDVEECIAEYESYRDWVRR